MSKVLNLSGVVWGSFGGHSGAVRGSFGDRFGVVRGSFGGGYWHNNVWLRTFALPKTMLSLRTFVQKFLNSSQQKVLKAYSVL